MAFPSMPVAFLSNFGGFDGLIVLVVALLIFGRKLPDVGKNLGRTIVEFKKGLSGADESAKEDKTEEEAPPARRLASGSRVSVNPPAKSSRALPKTEEV